MPESSFCHHCFFFRGLMEISTMVQPDSEADVQRWLTATGVESLCQWDVIVFLNRHQTVLMAPDDLARLLCYRTASIVATLDALAAHELVRLSPKSTRARLYESRVPSEVSRQEALERLLVLGDHR